MKSFQTYRIENEHVGLTVESYLKTVMQYSGRQIQKLTRAKGILLNNRSVFLQKKIKKDDVLKVLNMADKSWGVIPEPGTIDILYEDDEIIVLNKPAKQLVHPTGQTFHGTLGNYLAHYFEKSGRVCTIRPLHRLDRDTTGCVVFARDSRTQTELEKQIKNGNFKRSYLAIVKGIPVPEKGSIDAPIGPHPFKANQRAVNPDGEKAITNYSIVENFNGRSLLAVSLETGRTHQIRVHMAFIGHPVFGDKMYGKSSPEIDRQALHAESIVFDHPRNGQRISVKAPIPRDFIQILGNRENFS